MQTIIEAMQALVKKACDAGASVYVQEVPNLSADGKTIVSVEHTLRFDIPAIPVDDGDDPEPQIIEVT